MVSSMFKMMVAVILARIALPAAIPTPSGPPEAKYP
jgi:hypothetical protein